MPPIPISVPSIFTDDPEITHAVTVLSDDLRANVVGKLPARHASRVHTIPNFVDTARIVPADRMTPYRAELGIGAEPVLLYAGNIGYSQSVELLLEAARRLPHITVLVNGEGVARAIPMSSTKGMIGHPQGACGAAGLAATLLSLNAGFLPPTLNCDVPDPACDLDYVPNHARPSAARLALCNCMGFGSKNSVLVVRAGSD